MTMCLGQATRERIAEDKQVPLRAPQTRMHSRAQLVNLPISLVTQLSSTVTVLPMQVDTRDNRQAKNKRREDLPMELEG